MLDLCSEFYPLDAIERAAQAFAELAVVSITPGGARHQVRLEPRGAGDVGALRLEFANWVLAAGATTPVSSE